MLSQRIWVRKNSRKGLTFGMRASFHLRNIALTFFRWVALRFREITYAKNLAFPSHVLRGLFVEQETDRLFIVHEVKIKSHTYREEIWVPIKVPCIAAWWLRGIITP